MRRVASVITLLAVMPLTSAALGGDAALAESLFRQGRTLMDAGKFEEACPRLSESFAQDPTTGTLLALALCQERLGHTASAWASYADVVSRSKREGRTDREQAAAERRDALEPKLSRLIVEVSPAAQSTPGLVVTKDGQPLGKGAWGASMPLDPGEHTVQATAPGKRPWSRSVTLGEASDLQKIEVPALDDDIAAAAPAADVADGEPPSEESASEPRLAGVPLRTVGLVVGGAGIVGLGVSGFFGLRATSLNDDSKSGGHCDADNECDDPGLTARNDAIQASTMATVFLITGSVLTATGATLFLVGGPRERSKAAWVEAAPAIGDGAAAVTVRGQF